MHIKKLKSIFNKNKRKEEKGKNKLKKVIDPTTLPKNNLFKEAFLFKVLLTVNKRTKSKKKFKKKTKSI